MKNERCLSGEYLNQKEIEFNNNGYAIFHNLFNEQIVNKLSELTHSLISMALEIDIPSDNEIHKIMHLGSQFVLQKTEDQTLIHRIVWAASAKPELLEISRGPELKQIATKLLNVS